MCVCELELELILPSYSNINSVWVAHMLVMPNYNCVFKLGLQGEGKVSLLLINTTMKSWPLGLWLVMAGIEASLIFNRTSFIWWLRMTSTRRHYQIRLTHWINSTPSLLAPDYLLAIVFHTYPLLHQFEKTIWNLTTFQYHIYSVLIL